MISMVGVVTILVAAVVVVVSCGVRCVGVVASIVRVNIEAVVQWY